MTHKLHFNAETDKKKKKKKEKENVVYEALTM